MRRARPAAPPEQRLRIRFPGLLSAVLIDGDGDERVRVGEPELCHRAGHRDVPRFVEEHGKRMMRLGYGVVSQNPTLLVFP